MNDPNDPSTSDPNFLQASRQALRGQRAALLRGTPATDTHRKQLKRVEESLSWLDAGAYGRCSVCGGPIEIDRLRHSPETRTCRSCATAPGAFGWLL